MISICSADAHSEQIDVVLFNAFARPVWELMVEHTRTVSGVRELRRGSQFDFYTNGKMYAFGSREPAGGAPGDTYTAYRGIDGSTPKGRDILFDHAEACFLDVSLTFDRHLTYSPFLLRMDSY